MLGSYEGAPPKIVKIGDHKPIEIKLQSQTLKSAWKSEKLQNIRKLHREGRREEIKAGCLNCRHGAVKHGVNWIPEDWDIKNMEWKEGAMPVGRRVWKP